MVSLETGLVVDFDAVPVLITKKNLWSDRICTILSMLCKATYEAGIAIEEMELRYDSSHAPLMDMLDGVKLQDMAAPTEYDN